MSEITLTPIDIGNIPVSGDEISPDVFFDKDAGAIEGIPLWQGNRKVSLGELFDLILLAWVEGADATRHLRERESADRRHTAHMRCRGSR